MAKPNAWKLALVTAALGYAVDVYDMVLFSVLRIASLRAIGVAEADRLEVGVYLLNIQMVGMLIGGVFWGVLGDRRGRRSVLFGSILVYSLATLANGLVRDLPSYYVVRFVAGVGLAGELGAGVTLVTELMQRQTRGWGSAIIATAGVFGTTAAVLVSSRVEWRTAYIVGGCLGFGLLALRVGIFESTMFESMRSRADVARGKLVALLRDPRRASRYVGLVFVGLPIWFIAAILVTFAPEMGTSLGLDKPPDVGTVVLFTNAGLAAGDLASGLASQLLGSRRRVLLAFLVFAALSVVAYFVIGPQSVTTFYGVSIALGFSSGYMAVLFVTASEHFGTNVRATVATSVPNFVRASAIPMTMAFNIGKERLGVSGSAVAVGVVALAISFIGWLCLDETFGKELDYIEDLGSGSPSKAPTTAAARRSRALTKK